MAIHNQSSAEVLRRCVTLVLSHFASLKTRSYAKHEYIPPAKIAISILGWLSIQIAQGLFLCPLLCTCLFLFMYTTVQRFFLSLLNEISSCIQQGCIKLSKIDSKDNYNVTKVFFILSFLFL